MIAFFFCIANFILFARFLLETRSTRRRKSEISVHLHEILTIELERNNLCLYQDKKENM